MTGVDLSTITPELVANYGALTVFFVLVMATGLGIITHWYFKVRPVERAKQDQMSDLMVQQITLGRQVLETANEVIRMNTQEMKENRTSHQRIGERLECVEGVLTHHDARAEDIAKDIAVIKSAVGA